MRYYIINDGTITTTNDEDLALTASLDDLVVVIDTKLNQQIAMGTIGERFDVVEAR